MRVKICGITNLEDAICATNNGANAIGFVFHKSSARFIEPKKAKKIIKNLPPFVQTVGLFTTHLSHEINEIMSETKLNLAQIHTKVNDEFLSNLTHHFIEVIRVKQKSDLMDLKNKYYLIDAFTDNYGGEGVKVNADFFKDTDCSKWILAGGLNAQNLSDVKKFNFYGVDVSSGVESQKGVKDKEKIKKFIQLAHNI